jgi:NYN domain-containing protein
MDRCGIFVDAGHLLSQGGLLCCGDHRRATFTCAYPELIRAIVERVLAHALTLPLLRVYWYDGATDGIPTTDQGIVASQPNVKLRLGRISGGRQKGVDALIYRDLMTLARERAVTTAYLVAGDEDLREGVMAAQDLGVRVVLVGIQAAVGYNQSELLVREADENIVLDAAFLGPFFAPIPAAPAGAPIPQPKEVAAKFAKEWIANATEDDTLRLLGHAPYIPRELDTHLLSTAEQALGTPLRPKDKNPTRAALREAFWTTLRELAASVRKTGSPADETKSDDPK